MESYLYVDDIEQTLGRILAEGGRLVGPPRAAAGGAFTGDGPALVATDQIASWLDRVLHQYLVAELRPHNPQLLFELSADIDHDVLRDAVQVGKQFGALPDPEGHFPELRA